MTIKTASAGAYLVHAGVINTALPATQLGWFGTATSGAYQISVSQAKHDGDGYLLNWFDQNGTSKYATTRIVGNGANANAAGASPDLPCSLTCMAGTQQANRRELYWGANAAAVNTDAVGDPTATLTRTYIGALFVNGVQIYPSLAATQHAEYHWFSRVLTATEAGDIRTGAVLPESVTGWIDGLQLKDVDAGCSFTGSISGTVLTVASGLTGPVKQGRLLAGAGVAADTIIGTQISGTADGIGTYNVSVSQTVASVAMTGGGVYTSMNGRIFTAYGTWTGTAVDAHPVARTAPDTTPPTLTGTITLSGVTTTGVTTTCPVATDNVAVTGYQYNLDSAGWVDIAAGGRSITFTGLTPGSTYSVQMRAKDAVPNFSAPLTASQTLPTGGDTTVPTLTGAVVATAVTQTGYTLTWPAGADNVAVTSYERSLDGGATWTDVGSVLTSAVTGRTPGATDQVRMRAKDAAGNVSTPALSLAVTLDVYKCSILDWVLPSTSQHNIGEQWNISFHNVATRALVAYAPAAALVAGVNGAGQASRNLVVGNAAFVQGTTYAWFATHPTNATWFAVGLATAA